jgi:eukaryotic translation initiation factor 2C
VAHNSIGGKTMRVPNYIVLWDESKFTVDEIATLMFGLCHLYGYCAMPVSLPPPVMYAHQVRLGCRGFGFLGFRGFRV